MDKAKKEFKVAASELVAIYARINAKIHELMVQGIKVERYNKDYPCYLINEQGWAQTKDLLDLLNLKDLTEDGEEFKAWFSRLERRIERDDYWVISLGASAPLVPLDEAPKYSKYLRKELRERFAVSFDWRFNEGATRCEINRSTGVVEFDGGKILPHVTTFMDLALRPRG